MRHALQIAALSALTALSALAGAHAATVERVEPPFWWTGMHAHHLQLMVHGQDIGRSAPQLAYPGVTLAAATQVANPNYLFLDLDVTDDARPGQFEIRFNGAHPATYTYRLLARVPGSAQRQGFSSRDAIYELMPDRFANGNPANDTVAGMPDHLNRQSGGGRHGGDIDGIIAHLDFIAGLGFTQLWPTPLVENNAAEYSYHGYGATDLYRIDARYGSNADYLRLAAAARRHGIGLIQDVVLNHIGSGHWWMKDLPTPDWINHGGVFSPTAHHRMALADPYGSQEDLDNHTRGWFVPTMPDLNQRNPMLATYLIQNSIWWIEYAGLSGLRIDTFSYSDPTFLTAYTQALMEEYPRLGMVGEEWSKLVPVVARWQVDQDNANHYRAYMPGMMDFPLAYALRDALGTPGHDLTDAYETLALDYLYPHPERMVYFDGNHDMARIFSVLHEDLALWKIAMVHLMTVPRIAQFYSGTEVLMTSSTEGRDDASYRHDFPGGWPGDPVNAFTGAGLSANQRAARDFIRTLVNWRKGAAVIHAGRTMQYGPEDGTYVYFRYDGQHKVMVAMNPTPRAADLGTARFHEMLAGVRGGRDVLTGQRIGVTQTLHLPAKSVLLLELDPAHE
jgi:glycosidase